MEWTCSFVSTLANPHSSAILKYLVSKYRLPDHWYPADLQRRAKVDEYLGWHPHNLRMGAGALVFFKVTKFPY